MFSVHISLPFHNYFLTLQASFSLYSILSFPLLLLFFSFIIFPLARKVRSFPQTKSFKHVSVFSEFFYSIVSSFTLFFLLSLLSVLRSHRGHRKQRVVYLLSIWRPRAMGQELLNSDPVVEDSPVSLLHDFLLAQ